MNQTYRPFSGRPGRTPTSRGSGALLAALFALSGTAFAGYTPVVGSCVPSSLSPDLVDCLLKGDGDGSVVQGTAFKWNIKCYHRVGYRSNAACIYPPKTGTCTLKNPYRFRCEERVEADGVDPATIKDACDHVVQCLNNAFCVQMYCGQSGQDLRFGWLLDSFHED